jgi:hypothetical protein
MKPAELLQWYYMIFLVPFCASAMLLVLSSLHGGRRHGGHGGQAHSAPHGFRIGGHVTGGHVSGHGAQAGAGPHHAAISGHSANAGARHTAAAHAPAASRVAAHPQSAHLDAAHTAHQAGTQQSHTHDTQDEEAQAPRPAVQGNGLLATLFGLGRAPAPVLAQAFFLSWGFAGTLADQALIRGGGPSAMQMSTALGIATVAGLVGARLAAEVVGRMMPQDESLVVSRDSLFGLIGTIAFPASLDGGRILVYDEHGSLHDQTCRVPEGHEPIERGKKAVVVDVDVQGNLIVNELI